MWSYTLGGTVFSRKSQVLTEASVVGEALQQGADYSTSHTPNASPGPVPLLTVGGSAHASASDSDGVVVIGKGTKVTGEISDCARLEIQGTVEGNIVAEALVIRAGGLVNGNVSAAHAEVHGMFEGQLAVRDILDVRGTGRVEGDLSYGKLAVAMGGYIAGRINGETGSGAPETARSEPVTTTQPSPFLSNGTMNGYGH
jgi:cytoskeletal protein CcmA (bactofilin family)